MEETVKPEFVPEVGQVEIAPLSEFFPLEALMHTYFTEQPDRLFSLLNMTVEDVKPTRRVGAMEADLIAELDTGETVTVEWQVGRSDSRHLGQVVAYFAVGRPDMVLWVAEDFRDEDLQAIRLINQSTEIVILAVKLMLVRVSGSDWGLLAHVLAGAVPAAEPSVFRARRDQAYQDFWNCFYETAARRQLGMFGNRRSTTQRWIQESAKRGTNVAYRVGLAAETTRVSVYIDGGAGAEDYNRKVYEELRSRKDQLETAYGGPLEWEGGDEAVRRYSITVPIEGGYDSRVVEACEAAVAALARLQKSFTPVLERMSWSQLNAWRDN